MSYEYKTLADCIQSNDHLTDVDDSGFCNLCGFQDNPEDEGPIVQVNLTTRQAELLTSLLSDLSGQLQYRAMKIAPGPESDRFDETYDFWSGISQAVAASINMQSFMQPSPHINRLISVVRGQQLEDLENLLSITEPLTGKLKTQQHRTWKEISARTADLRLAYDTDQDTDNVDV